MIRFLLDRIPLVRALRSELAIRERQIESMARYINLLEDLKWEHETAIAGLQSDRATLEKVIAQREDELAKRDEFLRQHGISL